MVSPEDISFDSAKKNQKEPAESKAHVHVAKPQVRFQYLSVNKALKEYFFKALTKCFTEKTSLQSQLVRF